MIANPHKQQIPPLPHSTRFTRSGSGRDDRSCGAANFRFSTLVFLIDAEYLEPVGWGVGEVIGWGVDEGVGL
jgi:hypothetical protein